ncbi:MAG: hypothetical protein Q9191_006237 [Dirinaria sp. TL-2023a]
MAKKKRTAAQFFDDAKTHDLEPLIKTDLNSDKVSKHLESGTEINYSRMHERILVQDHAVYMLFIYSSTRVSEYFEFNMRRDSGRELLYEIIDFVVFKNEKEKAEIEMRVTRDAKGFSETPHKRLLHCLTLRDRAHEQPLLTVPMQF